MRPLNLSVLAVVSCLWMTQASPAQEGIAAGNRSAYLGGGRWAWTVYVQAPAGTIRSIRCVEYTLHPTIPNPVRQVCDPGPGPGYFPVSAEGWGTFPIPIQVQFRNGKTQTLTYQLRFERQAAQPAQAPAGLGVDNVARQASRTTWNWTVFLKGPEEALNQVRCVQYTLHPTFPDPVREVCSRGSGPQAFPLSATGWGTFEIGVRILLKDGKVQQLKHQLRF